MVTVWLFFLKFPDQSRKLSDHHSPRYAFRERFHDHFAQPLPELRFGARRGRRRRPLDHCRTAPASQIEPAFLSQLPISPGHRIVVNAEIQGELPDRRQLVAGAELASQEGSAEASNDLFGSRQTGGQVDLKQGRLVRHSLMYMYTILFWRHRVKRFFSTPQGTPTVIPAKAGTSQAGAQYGGEGAGIPASGLISTLHHRPFSTIA